MMLTIHGLPLSAKYRDVKMLIKEKCNISDYILDNLVSEEDGTKKVRVGLADEREGSYFMKCFNGFNMSGHILRVVPVGKAQQHNPPAFEQHGNFPPRNDYQNQPSSFGNRQMGNMSRNEPMAQDPVRPSPVRVDPWSHGSGGNQWGGSQGSQAGPNQALNQSIQQGYNYQQSQGIPASFGQAQQSGGSMQRGDSRQFDQRDQYQGQSRMQPPEQSYGYPSKNNLLDPARGDARAHVLRSVEIIDEPLARHIAQPNRYPQPGQNYDTHQKPITIMKDNFQGPQYNLDRPGQPPYQPPGGHPMSQAPRQLSPWNQPVPINMACGGMYNLPQNLSLVKDQMPPLQNPFDSGEYFSDLINQHNLAKEENNAAGNLEQNDKSKQSEIKQETGTKTAEKKNQKGSAEYKILYYKLKRQVGNLEKMKLKQQIQQQRQLRSLKKKLLKLNKEKTDSKFIQLSNLD